MDARLIVVDGSHSKREVRLRLPVTIGRDREADVTIVHPTVSRRHCELFERDGVLVVTDCGSLNGTIVGDHRVTEAVLRPGDRLTVGPITFVTAYELPTSAPLLPSRASGGVARSEEDRPRAVADDNDEVPALDEDSLEFDRLRENFPEERGEVIVPAIDAVPRLAPWQPPAERPALDLWEDSSEVFPAPGSLGLAETAVPPAPRIPAAENGLGDTLAVLPAQRAVEPVPAADPDRHRSAAENTPSPHSTPEPPATDVAPLNRAAELSAAEMRLEQVDDLADLFHEIQQDDDVSESLATPVAVSPAVADGAHEFDLENLPDLDEWAAELGPLDLSDVLPDGPAEAIPLTLASSTPVEGHSEPAFLGTRPVEPIALTCPETTVEEPLSVVSDVARESLPDFGEPGLALASEPLGQAAPLAESLSVAEAPEVLLASAAEAVPDFGDPGEVEDLSLEFASRDLGRPCPAEVPRAEAAEIAAESLIEAALPDFGEANPLAVTELEAITQAPAGEDTSQAVGEQTSGAHAGLALPGVEQDRAEDSLADEDWLTFDSLELSSLEKPRLRRESETLAETILTDVEEPPAEKIAAAEVTSAEAQNCEAAADAIEIETTTGDVLSELPPVAGEPVAWFDTFSIAADEPAAHMEDLPLASWLVDEEPVAAATEDIQMEEVAAELLEDALPEFEVDAAELSPPAPSSRSEAEIEDISFDESPDPLLDEMQDRPREEIKPGAEPLPEPSLLEKAGDSLTEAAGEWFADLREPVTEPATVAPSPPAADAGEATQPPTEPSCTAPPPGVPPGLRAGRAKRRWWWPFELNRSAARPAAPDSKPAPPAPVPSAAVTPAVRQTRSHVAPQAPAAHAAPPPPVAGVAPPATPSVTLPAASRKASDRPQAGTEAPAPRRSGSSAAEPRSRGPTEKDAKPRGWFRFWRRRGTSPPAAGEATPHVSPPNSAAAVSMSTPALELDVPEVAERADVPDADQVLLDPLADYELLRPSPDPTARRVPRDAELERFLKDLG